MKVMLSNGSQTPKFELGRKIWEVIKMRFEGKKKGPKSLMDK